jgi:hypothetical protein
MFGAKSVNDSASRKRPYRRGDARREANWSRGP